MCRLRSGKMRSSLRINVFKFNMPQLIVHFGFTQYILFAKIALFIHCSQFVLFALLVLFIFFILFAHFILFSCLAQLILFSFFLPRQPTPFCSVHSVCSEEERQHARTDPRFVQRNFLLVICIALGTLFL